MDCYDCPAMDPTVPVSPDMMMKYIEFLLFHPEILIVISCILFLAFFEWYICPSCFCITVTGLYYMETSMYEIAIAHEPGSAPYRAWWFLTIGLAWWLQMSVLLAMILILMDEEPGDKAFWGGYVAFLLVSCTFVYLGIIGVDEMLYILRIPAKVPGAVRLIIRAGPRFIVRYGQLWMAKEKIEGSVLTWWANDLWESIMVQESY